MCWWWVARRLASFLLTLLWILLFHDVNGHRLDRQENKKIQQTRESIFWNRQHSRHHQLTYDMSLNPLTCFISLMTEICGQIIKEIGDSFLTISWARWNVHVTFWELERMKKLSLLHLLRNKQGKISFPIALCRMQISLKRRLVSPICVLIFCERGGWFPCRVAVVVDKKRVKDGKGFSRFSSRAMVVNTDLNIKLFVCLLSVIYHTWLKQQTKTLDINNKWNNRTWSILLLRKSSCCQKHFVIKKWNHKSIVEIVMRHALLVNGDLLVVEITLYWKTRKGERKWKSSETTDSQKWKRKSLKQLTNQ